MPATSDEAFLIWEDENPGSEHWWLARAHDGAEGNRDFFIVEDDLSGYLVGVVRRPPAVNYKVIAAASLRGSGGRADAVAEVKAIVMRWLTSASAHARGNNIWRWRRARWSSLVWSHLPIALSGFAVGGALGLLVSFFAVSSGLVGWPMVAAGLVIGAGSGPALKFLVDRRPRNTVVGPWVRFSVITVAAIVGAALAVGGVFTAFWEF